LRSAMVPPPVTRQDVLAARETIAGRVHRTPTLTWASLARELGVPVYLKAELFQRTGSFKPRGVLNKLASLSAEEKARGVIGISARSEEHTSELQSLRHLVCRLLLEASRDLRDLHSFPTRRSSDLGTGSPDADADLGVARARARRARVPEGRALPAHGVVQATRRAQQARLALGRGEGEGCDRDLG